MQTWVQRSFAPLKRWLPRPVSNAIRSTVTAAFTPLRSSIRSGHFRSSFARKAVDRRGNPLPWYTYPAIEFLRSQAPFTGRSVLEFGSGQSSLWWAANGASVLALEDDAEWGANVRGFVDLRIVNGTDCARFIAEARAILDGQAFDVIVVDGLFRSDAARLALDYLKPGGALICDNAEGYGFFEALSGAGLRRVDFYGNAPGVILQHSTSVFFRDGCFLFENAKPIQRLG